MSLIQQLKQAQVINERDRERLTVTVPLSMLVAVSYGVPLPKEVLQELRQIGGKK